MYEATEEKSPVDDADFSGLQLDTRATEQQGKYVHPFQPHRNDEKHNVYFANSKTSGGAYRDMERGYDVPPSAIDPTMPEVVQEKGPPVPPKDKKTWGMNRARLWILLAILSAIVIIAATVGGVLGSRGSVSAATTTVNPTSAPLPLSTSGGPNPTTTPPSAINSILPPYDVMVDSPITVGSFALPSDQQQKYAVYFQTANGNLKVIYGSSTGWPQANPFLTDAINNTGLASMTYPNVTTSLPQTSVFYMGPDSSIREKRLIGMEISGGIYEIASLTAQNLVGNPNIPTAGTPFPYTATGNAWSSYRVGCVYSPNLSGGALGRFYYHVADNSGSGKNYVQEMKWFVANDTWVHGQQIIGPAPGSALSPTIDPATKTLRLFYATVDQSLQESWLDITNPSATYQTGIRVPSLLVNPSAAIAAISNVTNTMVYYYDRTNSVLTVRELTFSGIPGSSTNKETFNNPATAPIVTQPALMTSSKQWSVYQPLGAGISTTPGPTNQAISIFWAEGVVTSESGYSALKVATRNPGQPWNPTNGVALNLGTSSDAPHGLLA